MERVPTIVLVVIVAILLVGNILLYQGLFTAPTLRITVTQTEKGPVALVHLPSDKVLLIGAGADASVLRMLGENLPFWQRSIAAVLLPTMTTVDAGGLHFVADRYKIGTLFRSPSRGTPSLESSVGDATTKSLVRPVVRGDRISFGTGVVADVLWPPQTPTPLKAANGPLVLRLSYGATSILVLPELSSTDREWIEIENPGSLQAGLLISSTTPPGEYVSDGASFVKRD